MMNKCLGLYFVIPLVTIMLLIGIFSCATPAATPTSKPAPAPSQPPATATQAPSPAPITLNWVSFISKNDPQVQALQKTFFDKVNERAKGRLVINYKGGPESMPSTDQPKGVQSGSVDIDYNIAGFVEPLVPGVNALVLSELTVDEERKAGGAYDYFAGLYKKAGLFYIGRGSTTKEGIFYTYLNKKVEKPQDFVGLKIGSAAAAIAAVNGWGASNVSLKPEEYYAALEQRIIDGQAGSSLTSFAATGRQEVVKYVIDHPYYANSTVLVMNLDKWNSLPKDLQNIIMEAEIQSERENSEYDVRDRAKAREIMIKAKVEFYKFAPDTAKWYIDTAYKALWDSQQKKFPEVTAQLLKLLKK